MRGAAALTLRHRRVLRVEKPEGIPLQAIALGGRQRIRVTPVVAHQVGDVRGTACRIADRVDEHLDTGHADVGVEAMTELDDLGIDGGPGIADRLDVELPELPVPARLGTVVAEHRSGRGELHRLRPRLHPVLHVGPRNPCGGLRAERPGFGFLRPRRDAEQLLLDDVGDLTDAPFEDRSLLEQRGLDGPVAVPDGQFGGDPLQAVEDDTVVGKQIAGAPGGAEGRHRPEV